MSGHHARPGLQPRRTPHPAIAAAAAVILLALAACTSTSSTTSPVTSASAVAAASTGPGGHPPTLTGSGSTFDAPFFAVAFVRYQQQHPGVTISYSAVGSSAGIAAFSARQVDFGASDVPMTASEQAAARGGPAVQVPVDLGGEGIAYNLSLPAGARLHLTGPVLAAIFLGQITRWNDPAITTLNPRITLPPAAITVVHRSDGSGTTYIFSNYLSAVDPAWAAKVGTGKTLNWPAGEGAEGNPGVATAVDRTPFSIGYVEQAYSQGLTLPFAAIRNQAGQYVIPSAQSVAAVCRRRRRPETRHHPGRLLHRQPARRGQLPDQRVQLGAGLHPPVRPGHRAGPGRHAGLAHPRRPGLRRRERLRAAATADPATRADHAPAGHRSHRHSPAELTTTGTSARSPTTQVGQVAGPRGSFIIVLVADQIQRGDRQGDGHMMGLGRLAAG
jgi:phosphate ABC transporter phosphate-binding protein